MVYDLLPNIAFVVALAGLVILLAKRLPEARRLAEVEEAEKQAERVLPVDTEPNIIARLFSRLVFYWLKVWNWMLEAKDLKPGAVASYRMKKVIKKQKPKAKAQVKPAPQTQETKEAPVAAQNIPSQAEKEAAALAQIPIEQLTEEQIFLRLKDTPKDTQLLTRLAQVYLDAFRYAEAAEVFEYLLTLDPGEARHYAKLGFCNFQLEQFASAITNYEKSIALDPAHPNRYYNLALAYEMLKNWTQARKAFKKAIELDPENAKYKIALNTLNRNLRESRKNSI